MIPGGPGVPRGPGRPTIPSGPLSPAGPSAPGGPGRPIEECGSKTKVPSQYYVHPDGDQDNNLMQTCSMSETRAMSLQCQVNVHNYVRCAVSQRYLLHLVVRGGARGPVGPSTPSGPGKPGGPAHDQAPNISV